MRRPISLLVIGLLSLMVRMATVSAGTPSWSAWLYDPASGRILEVADDGTLLNDLYLPVSQGFDQLPANVAVSHGGSLLAFVAANSDTGERQLVVFDAAAQFQKLLVSLPPLMGDSLSVGDFPENAFNDTDTLLAFGYTPSDGEQWRLDVYDLGTGAVTQTLQAFDTAGFEVFNPDGRPLALAIQRFEGTNLTFSLAMLSGEGQARYSSFTWDILANHVTAAPEWSQLDRDFFPPPGEIIMPVDDPAQPKSAESFLAASRHNTLYVYDPAQNAYFPFYNDPNRSLFWPRFVQNGELIFVAGYTADSDSPDLFLIERDGTVTSAVEVPGITSVRGLTDGLIYTLEVPGDQGNSVTLVYVNTRAGETLEDSAPLWTGEPNAAYRIVWAKDNREVEGAEYTDWVQLSAPVRVGE